MPEKWTGNLIGKMHNNKISFEELGKELGLSKSYVSMILNGSRKPKGARIKFETAFNSIIQKRQNHRRNYL